MSDNDDNRFAAFTLVLIAAVFAAVLSIAFIIVCLGTRYNRSATTYLNQERLI